MLTPDLPPEVVNVQLLGGKNGASLFAEQLVHTACVPEYPNTSTAGLGYVVSTTGTEDVCGQPRFGRRVG